MVERNCTDLFGSVIRRKNLSIFIKKRLIFGVLAAGILAIPISWGVLPLLYPNQVPVSLELETPQEGEVQLGWGDSPEQVITLTPENKPAYHHLEIVATGEKNELAKNNAVEVRALWHKNGMLVPFSALSFDQDWRVNPKSGSVLTYAKQPAALSWQGIASKLTLALPKHKGAGKVFIRWDGKETPLDLYAAEPQIEFIKLAGDTRFWQGELPSQQIERLWLRLGQGIEEGTFVRLSVGTDPSQIWTAETLSQSKPQFQGLTVKPSNSGLHFQVISELGEVGLPGVVPITPVRFNLTQAFWIWLGVTVSLMIVFLAITQTYPVLNKAFFNETDFKEAHEGAKRYPRVSQLTGRLFDRVLSGRFWSLKFYIVFGFLVFLFLLVTIHNRDVDEIYYGVKNTLFMRIIMTWMRDGYLANGGMAFFESVAENPTQELWRSTSMGWLVGLYLLERIHYWFTGEYSYRLAALYPQVFVWFSSALLGLLAMRLARRMGIKPLHTLVLGVACLAVHQTFPSNLWYYWRTLPAPMLVLLVILFLLIEESTFDRDQIPPWISFLRGMCVFAMFFIEPFGTFFFISTYLLMAMILDPALLKKQSILKTMILPAGLMVVLFAAQILWVKINYPQVELVGSGFMFRTGFDGAINQVGDHFDLFFNYRRLRSLIYQWKYLFITGSISLLALIGLYLKLPQLKCAVILLAVALGLYIPFAFMFSQSAIIHPQSTDIYLAFSLILALFAVLPAALEKLAKNPGIFVLLAIVLAYCYAMVQIRTYAIEFPLT